MLEILNQDKQYKGDDVEFDSRGYFPGITSIAELNIKYSLDIEAKGYGIKCSCPINYDDKMFIPRIDYLFWEGEGTNKISYYLYIKRELESMTKSLMAYHKALEEFMQNPLGKVEPRDFEFLEGRCRNYERKYYLVNLIEQIREKRKCLA